MSNDQSPPEQSATGNTGSEPDEPDTDAPFEEAPERVDEAPERIEKVESEYTSAQIHKLEGLDAVRKRPGNVHR